MKTSINKDTIAANRDTARRLEAEARNLRYQNAKMREQAKAEEEAILKNMVETVMDAGYSMTARQISAAINGDMSVHEVAGQLTWASTCRESGHAPRGYRGHTMAHETMTTAAPDIRVDEQVITHHFAEVDASGKVIPGGRTFKQSERRNLYAISR